MSEPHQPPRPPEFSPGQATPPPPYEPAPDYPPTSPFPPVNYAPPGHTPDYGGGYPPPGPSGHPTPDQQGYPGYPQPAPRRSNKPLIAVIVAVSVLLCGGVVTSGVLLVKRATQKVEEVAAPILEPTLPELPTEAPELPGLPTDLPTFPTDLPDLPGVTEGRKITVTYEVDGDGPARILYTEKLGTSPQIVENVKLPWKFTTTMEGASFVSVVAQRVDPDDGSIRCRASVDDEQVAEQKTKGALATASCYKLIFN